MKTKTKIEKQTQKKNNPELVQTIRSSKKKSGWFKVAEILSGPRRKRINLNLKDIDKKVKEGEIIVVPGKILSQGELTKKIKKIVALNFSETAKEKLLKSKIVFSNILEEIKKNPDAKGVKFLVQK